MLREGFVCDDAVVSGAGAFLLSVLQHHFQEKNKRFDTPYVITEDHNFPEARKQLDRVTARGYGNCEEWTDDKEPHEARSLMTRLHGARSLVASTIWNREDPFFPVRQQQETTHQLPKHVQVWYYAGFKGGGVFAPFHLAS